jgi:hypothetical protein
MFCFLLSAVHYASEMSQGYRVDGKMIGDLGKFLKEQS